MTGTDLTCRVMIGNQSVGIIQTDRETATLTYDEGLEDCRFSVVAGPAVGEGCGERGGDCFCGKYAARGRRSGAVGAFEANSTT